MNLLTTARHVHLSRKPEQGHLANRRLPPSEICHCSSTRSQCTGHCCREKTEGHRLQYHSLVPSIAKYQWHRNFGAEKGLKTILGKSNIVVCLVPLTQNTGGLIKAARLTQMKPRAAIINFAHGPGDGQRRSRYDARFRLYSPCDSRCFRSGAVTAGLAILGIPEGNSASAYFRNNQYCHDIWEGHGVLIANGQLRTRRLTVIQDAVRAGFRKTGRWHP